MSVGSPYHWYQIDTAPTHPSPTTKKSQLWPLLTPQSHERRLHYTQCRGKPPLPCSVKHNAKCHIKVFSVEVWKHLHNKKVVLGYYHFPSLWMWRTKYSIHRGEFGDVPVNAVLFFSFAFLYSMFILIFSRNNICTVGLLSIKRHAVFCHFYLTFISLFIWETFDICLKRSWIWIFLCVRCIINFETGLYVTSTVTFRFSRWPIIPTSK